MNCATRLSIVAALLWVWTLPPASASAAPSTLYFEDNFEGQHFFSDETIDNRRFSYVEGQYEIDTSQAQTYGQSVLLDDLNDYSVQATGRLVSSTEQNGGGFGISFNYRETAGNPNFLLFLAYDRGFYTVLRYANDKTEIIVQPTRTRLFKPGEPMTLRVDNNNGRITFYINGVESATHQETQLRSGGFGLFASAQTVARFDDFQVYADKRTVAGGFSDDFSGAKVLYEGSWGEVAYRYQGGRYIVDTSGTSYIGLSPFPEPQLTFEFSADVELVSGQPGGGLGLYVRDHANPSGAFNQFRFLVSDGWFAVERSIDDRPLALAQWSESSAVQKRGVNKLRLVCRGQDITFFVNGVEVYRVRDETPHAGAFGFFAAGGMVAAFDNARMVPLQ